MRITTAMLVAALAACATRTERRDSAVTRRSDTDVAASGTGIPSGYTALTDDGATQPTSVRYATSGGGWEVTTGAAHIVYAAKDSARGAFTARATFEQLEAPRHPEAYGIFVGGRNLGAANQAYTYFIVRGTGEFAIKTRNGSQVANVVDWKASPAVAKQDSAGRATYRLAIRAGADSVRFLIGDTQVHAVRAGTVPTDGVAGLRINHNLHVRSTPIVVAR